MKKLGLIGLAGAIALSYGCSTQFTPNLMGSNMPTMLGMNQFTDISAYKKKTAKWTIMVHMGAENNLNSFGFSDMDEMASGLTAESVKNINVIVLYDGMKNGDSQIFKLKPGGRTPIDDKGAVIPQDTKEIDSGSIDVAKKFVNWTIKNYPAQHYMIDIWDHGAGIFRQSEKQKITKGFAYDDNGTNMETRDLTPLLQVAAQTAGKRIDILGFDACLMGHLEIAYQVKDYCDILVASEELEPGDGWDYKAWFANVGKSDMTPRTVASILVDTYGKFYGGRQDATLSAVDIPGTVNGLVPVINKLGVALKSALPTHKQTISGVRDNTQSFYNSNCADVGDFLKKISAVNITPEVKSIATEGLNVYKQVIIRETHTNSRPGATGMVIYFPRAWQTYNPTYDKPQEILFAETKLWGDFLKEFVKK